MQKRDPKKREYKPYIIPEGWNCPLYLQPCKFLTEQINCTWCGKITFYWKCYTSRLIHSHIGLGYPVCSECYGKECDDIKAMGEND